MDDLISRKSAVVQLSHNKDKGDEEWRLAVENDIQTIWDMPSAQSAYKWIPVEESLPKNEEMVLVTVEMRPYFTGTRKPYRKVIRAFHEDGTWNDMDSAYNWDDDSWSNYVDENGYVLIPEGWYEAVDYFDEFGVIDDKVTAWMPLPTPHRHDKW